MAKNIPVDQRFPFDFCAVCDKFEPVVEVQKTYSITRKLVKRNVVMSCRNDWLCRQLKDNIDDITSEFTGGDVN